MKNSPIFPLFLLLLFLFSCNLIKPKTNDTATSSSLSVIAFGSCNNQNEAQPLWKDIIKNNPDLWIWLGDNIYADTEDMAKMKQMYDKQLQHPGYQSLLKTCPVLGTWDDHDYGVNDGGKDYVRKEESKQLMFDFLGVPKTAETRNRPGAYQSYVYGKSPRQVKIILLDTRSFKDHIERKKKTGYVPNPDAEILGETQWLWLENELRNNTADLTIIANGTQILPKEHKYEKWANFPTERDRFLQLMDIEAKNLFILSGDRHFGEISAMTTKSGQSIYEVTSSGLTHSYEALKDEPNQFRRGKFTGQLNFGLMLIEWDSPVPNVHLQLRGIENVVREDVQVELVGF